MRFCVKELIQKTHLRIKLLVPSLLSLLWLLGAGAPSVTRTTD